MKKLKIYERALEVGNYIAQTGATVRETASKFKVSKSTIHKDISERLPVINQELYDYGVKPVLVQNKAERHIRGGEATKMKHLHLRNR